MEAQAQGAAVDPATKARVLLAAGIDLHRAGRAAEAVEAYGRAIECQPDLVEAYHNLGVALRASGRPAAAIACLRRALRLRPGHPATLASLGNALRAEGEASAAVDLLRQAAAGDPRSPEIAVGLGLALRDAGRLDESAAAFTRALELRPDRKLVQIDRGVARLLAGDLPGGFSDLALRHPPPIVPVRGRSWPRWDGGMLDGRHLLVRADDSAIDALRFARFVPLAAARGVPVILEGPDELLPLLETVEGTARVVRRGGRFANVAAEAPLADLPRILGTTLATIPAEVPYLKVPRGPRIDPPPAIPGRTRIGVAWRAAADEPDAEARSVPLELFLSLAERTDVELLALESGGAPDIAAAGAGALVRDLGAAPGDFATLATAVAAMDLVIAADAPAAHLAGALGRPVWVLLPHAPDWCWMLGRTESPWYPTAWLFRQPAPGDWKRVMARVRKSLDAALDEGAGAETTPGGG
ncbi:MAG: tetratricopeptide repeat protein [Alphaproteobacteria bacterium]|nr:tetratricopeptide repeat protein [Alphaproteobacteria bacterium]